MHDTIGSGGASQRNLFRISALAAVLSAAGLPLYVHLPLFATSQLGLDLASVGLMLLGLRAFDFVQDPWLGGIVDRYPGHAGLISALAMAGMAVGFLLLFAVVPPFSATLWLALTLALIFTSFSLASIQFYARGVSIAGPGGHLRLAFYREGGLLAGILLATIAPSALALRFDDPYRPFGILLAVLCLVAIPAVRPLWRLPVIRNQRVAWQELLTPAIRRLLLIGLVNTLPLAFTSTLFLLFVRDQLALPDWSGAFLLLFFLSAGLAAPLWLRLAGRYGPRRVLLAAMTLAVLSFAGASGLVAGDALPFAIICVLSGATLSADIIILPALLSQRLARNAGNAGVAFGLWNLATKLALALAAGAIATADLAGATWTGASAGSLSMLTIGYALVPCLLKLLAIALVFTLSDSEDLQ